MKLVFMGVCGCGKTTVALRIAEILGSSCVIEADVHHSPEMKDKMRSGTPLTDEDRWPWLDRLNHEMRNSSDEWTVATCSALKRRYRERLARGLEGEVHFIFLNAPRAVIQERIAQRQHEYMPASLLDSQYAALEIPESDEPVSTISAGGSHEETLAAIQQVIARLPQLKAS